MRQCYLRLAAHIEPAQLKRRPHVGTKKNGRIDDPNLGALGRTRIMKRETAILGMSNLVHPDTVMESFVKGQGFGAGGRVTIAPSARGEGIGTFGWGGAASTVAWVDRSKNIRASGWSQIMTRGDQPFTTEFGKTVYSTL